MTSDQPPNPSLSRREFIAQGLHSMLNKASHAFKESLRPVQERTFLRPPGAQMETIFLGLCTRCDACTAACPHEAISVHYGSGAPQDGAPVLIDLQAHPCLLCPDTPCITACPTNALMPVEDIRHIKIGTAHIDTLRCVAFRGEGCQICYEVCPLKNEAIELVEGLPFVIPDGCTGCGICQHHCPEGTSTTPSAIQIFPL